MRVCRRRAWPRGSWPPCSRGRTNPSACGCPQHFRRAQARCDRGFSRHSQTVGHCLALPSHNIMTVSELSSCLVKNRSSSQHRPSRYLRCDALFCWGAVARPVKGSPCRVAGGEKAEMPLATLTQMQAAAVDFAHALSRALVGADPGDVVSVARAVYAPYEAQIARCAPDSCLPLDVVPLFGGSVLRVHKA